MSSDFLTGIAMIAVIASMILWTMRKRANQARDRRTIYVVAVPTARPVWRRLLGWVFR